MLERCLNSSSLFEGGGQFGVQSERLDPVLSATQVSSQPMNAELSTQRNQKAGAGGRAVAGSNAVAPIPFGWLLSWGDPSRTSYAVFE